jgi:PTS system N-acetylglucosamine-specific IIC component
MDRLNFAVLQQLGRALMLPIAVLPIASLLLRLGQDDLLNIPFVAAAGSAIFSNLGLLFAIGIAVGFARDNHGAAGLAGAVGYLVATKGAEALIQVPPEVTAGLAGAARDLAVAGFKTTAIARISVPAGILSGIIGGVIYNRFKDIKLPDYLAFFAGRRFVPIATGCGGLVLAAGFGFFWPALQAGLDGLSRSVLGAGPLGLFLFGALNRLLIVTGLHHILNNIAWFLLGDFHGVTGDLKRFFAGDPDAGRFMSGFFPVMMFGLPAACLAMYQAAPPSRKKAVGGLLLSMALTSFLTGVTEPIEFSFMFLAPGLYAAHAMLTGLAMVTMDVLGVKLGFGFSAGLFDYLLNYGKATRPLLLIPVGAVYFGLYWALFRAAIGWFGLKTPGREDESPQMVSTNPPAAARGAAFVAALGGPANLRSVDACTTRLRLIVGDPGAIDEAALRALGAVGFVRPGKDSLQVVLGPIADAVADEIRIALADPPPAAPPSARDWLNALGGTANVRAVETRGTRLRVLVELTDAVDEARLAVLGVRGVARPAPGVVHLVMGADAEALGAGLRALVRA